MRKRFLIIVLLVLALISPELHARFVNSDIYKTGTFANGVEYCFVNNTAVKGIVDIALVQKNPGDVRAILDSLDGFGKRSPGKYMIDRGVAYSRRGYAFEEDGSTIYRFNDVPVGSTIDSTLFLLANLMETSPTTQTLIMCGDITPATIIDRMNLLLMNRAVREPDQQTESEYVWKPRTERTVKYIDNGKEHAALVTIRFFIPRLPEAAQMTSQPVFCRFFSACLTALLRERMNTIFKSRNIAYSDLRGIYLGSADGAGDETYTITFKVLTAELPEAMNCMASVMSGICQDGVTPEEFTRVNSRVLDFLADKIKNIHTNAEYMRMCLNACLYGASLAAPQDLFSYFSQRQFGAEQITHFFNRFSHAMLKNTKTASYVILASNGPDINTVMESFDRGWLNPITPEISSVPDFEKIMPKPWAPVGIRREQGDNISGGTMWRFANGMKVIFKRTNSDIMSFYLVVRGGIHNIEDPQPGETAFVQDMFKLCRVGSLSHSDFDLVLASKRILLNNYADNNGLTVYGKIPSNELAYLPAVFSQLKNLSLPSEEEIAYYRKCVMTGDETPMHLMNYRIDQLLRPDDDQLGYKFSQNITDSTAIKALKYYKKQFTKMNDGVLIIFGDLNPDKVWRIFHQRLGVLSTTRKPITTHWTERPQISSGINIVVDSLAAMDVNSARIRMKLGKPITRENNFTFTLATMCIEETMQKLLYERGFSVSSTTSFGMYPEDTFTVTFDLMACKPSGLPKHVGNPASVYDALADIHSGLKSGDDISTSRLDMYKTILTSKLSNEMTDETKLIAYSLLRYASGKNMTSDYKSQIKGVSEAAVREMANEILNAGRVEYIVK